MKFCSQCGVINEDHHKFCNSCGRSFDGGTTSSLLGSRSGKKVVYLSDYNGFAFEDLCCKIFNGLGYGDAHTTPKTGDKGKDIVIKTNKGNIFVECKHFTVGPVGRPQVQKLHSAVIGEHAISGILVTSGRFSNEAQEHVKGILPEIRLIDGTELKQMALDAGYDLIYDDEPPRNLDYFYPLITDDEIASEVSIYVNRRFSTHYFEWKYDILYWPFYRFDLIMPIGETNAFKLGPSAMQTQTKSVYLDAINKSYEANDLANSYNGPASDIFGVWDDQDVKARGYPHREFPEQDDDLPDIIKGVEKGWRNVFPAMLKKEVIQNRYRVYIPIYIIKFNINNIHFELRLGIGNKIEEIDDKGRIILRGRKKYYFSEPKIICHTCKKEIMEGASFCFICGRIICPPYLNRHSFNCNTCGRTVCLDCSTTKRAAVLSSTYVRVCRYCR